MKCMKPVSQIKEIHNKDVYSSSKFLGFSLWILSYLSMDDSLNILQLQLHRDGRFPGSSAGKESTCNAGDPSSIPALGRSPGGGHGNPLQCSCLENPHGHKSLVGYSPWGHKESETIERLSAAQNGDG